MQDLPKFHQLVGDLVRHVGLEVPDLEESRDMFSLVVNEAYTLHLGLLDDAAWFMLAELNDQDIARNPERLMRAMQVNQLAQDACQPIMAIGAEGAINGWVRLPLANGDLPTSLDALHVLLDAVDSL